MNRPVSMVIGAAEHSALGTGLRAKAAASNVQLVFLDDWSYWSFTLDCLASEFVLEDSRRSSVVVHSRDIKSVVMFGLPSPPRVHEGERPYQEAEYTAILVGMLFALRHPLAERWRYLASGFSDCEIAASELCLHPRFSGLGAPGDFGCAVSEALFLHGTWYFRSGEGLLISTNTPAWNPRGEVASIPVHLVMDHSRNTVSPFVGLLPRWPHLPDAVVDHVLTPHMANHSRRIDFFGVCRRPARAVPMTIAAHKRDSTARYLMNVCRESNKPFEFIDMTSLYSEECPDPDSMLAKILSAEFLIPRPISLPTTGPKGERYSIETSMRALRCVETNPHFVLGRPSAGFSNDSKPAHLIELSRAGWMCPDTIATNDPDVALEFIKNNGNVVFKSCSSLRSIATSYDESMRDRLVKIRNAPVLFQARIDGPDCRVHVVDRNVFPLRITCPDLDYRYSWGSTEFDDIELPAELVERCIDTGNLLLDEILGIDLKQDAKSGAWYILEANPMPAFSGYDLKLGGRIARYILRMAEGGRAG